MIWSHFGDTSYVKAFLNVGVLWAGILGWLSRRSWAFISLCFLIVDAMWAATSHTCCLDLLPWWTMMDHDGPWWTMTDHDGPWQTMTDHDGSWWTMMDHEQNKPAFPWGASVRHFLTMMRKIINTMIDRPCIWWTESFDGSDAMEWYILTTTICSNKDDFLWP